MTPFILYILLVLAVVAAGYVFEQSKKEAAIDKIEQYIHTHGGRDVDVYHHQNSQHTGRTCKLSYTDRQGKKHYTQCKVDEQLFWTEDPVMYLVSSSSSKLEIIDSLAAENQALRAKLSGRASHAEPVSSKEQIITDLTVQNEQLEEELAALRQQLTLPD